MGYVYPIPLFADLRASPSQPADSSSSCSSYDREVSAWSADSYGSDSSSGGSCGGD